MRGRIEGEGEGLVGRLRLSLSMLVAVGGLMRLRGVGRVVVVVVVGRRRLGSECWFLISSWRSGMRV